MVGRPELIEVLPSAQEIHVTHPYSRQSLHHLGLQHAHLWSEGGSLNIVQLPLGPIVASDPDAFNHRGSTFPLHFFLNEGFLNPKSSECQSCFEKWHFCRLGPWDYSSENNLVFA